MTLGGKILRLGSSKITSSRIQGQGVVKRRYAALRATLLCDASGTRIDALMSRFYKPEKAVSFTSFSTNFTFFPLKRYK